MVDEPLFFPDTKTLDLCLYAIGLDVDRAERHAAFPGNPHCIGMQWIFFVLNIVDFTASHQGGRLDAVGTLIPRLTKTKIEECPQFLRVALRLMPLLGKLLPDIAPRGIH